MSFDILNDQLAPGTRLFLGAVGGALFTWGLLEDAPEACVLGTIGATLALPAVTGRGAAACFAMCAPEGQARQPELSVARVSMAGERRGEPVPIM
jgi:hypothetical protein